MKFKPGITSYLSAYSKWDQAKKAMDQYLHARAAWLAVQFSVLVVSGDQIVFDLEIRDWLLLSPWPWEGAYVIQDVARLLPESAALLFLS